MHLIWWCVARLNVGPEFAYVFARMHAHRDAHMSPATMEEPGGPGSQDPYESHRGETLIMKTFDGVSSPPPYIIASMPRSSSPSLPCPSAPQGHLRGVFRLTETCFNDGYSIVSPSLVLRVR